MSIKDGGPAFPEAIAISAAGDVHQGFGGMTLRDYFIAHAPVEPQPWFQPVMPKNVVWHPAGEVERQRYIQWPAAWADAMLKAREQQP